MNRKPAFLASERVHFLRSNLHDPNHGSYLIFAFRRKDDRTAWMRVDPSLRKPLTEAEADSIAKRGQARRGFILLVRRESNGDFVDYGVYRELPDRWGKYPDKRTRTYYLLNPNRSPEPKKRHRNPDDTFGDVISRYTRKQALEDGVLVDMTEWGSATTGFHGGFTVPVAFTNHLWGDVDKKVRLQDTRGRAHDVLWMASLAIKGGMKRGIIGKTGGRVLFDLLLQVGRKRKQRLAVDLGGGDDGEPVVTIGYPEDF